MKTKLLIAALTLSLGATPSYGVPGSYANKTCPKGAVYSTDKSHLFNVIIGASKKGNNDFLTEFKNGGKTWLIPDQHVAVIKKIVSDFNKETDSSPPQFELNNGQVIKNQLGEDVLVCKYNFIGRLVSDKNIFTLMMVDKI